jgi:hypothetical protein
MIPAVYLGTFLLFRCVKGLKKVEKTKMRDEKGFARE